MGGLPIVASAAKRFWIMTMKDAARNTSCREIRGGGNMVVVVGQWRRREVLAGEATGVVGGGPANFSDSGSGQKMKSNPAKSHFLSGFRNE